MSGLSDKSKNFHDTFSRVDTIPDRDRQTDEQTDGHVSAANKSLKKLTQ